ncbi:MAG: hypothetical protein AAGM38_14905 [Pseudomonadota bacterium]
MGSALRRIVISTLFVAAACFGAVAISVAAPLAQVGLGAALIAALAVFLSARALAPRIAGLRHLVGLLVAVWGAATHFVAWAGYAGAPDALAFDVAQARAAVLTPPQGWPDLLSAVADRAAFETGGAALRGEPLLAAWIALLAIFALSGLLGGHLAYWRGRS